MPGILLLLTESFSRTFHLPATSFQYPVLYFHSTEVKPYLKMFHGLPRRRGGHLGLHMQCTLSREQCWASSSGMFLTQILLSVRGCKILLKWFSSPFVSNKGGPTHNSVACLDNKISGLCVKFPFHQSSRGGHVQLPKFFF